VKSEQKRKKKINFYNHKCSRGGKGNMKGFCSLWSFLLMRLSSALWSRKGENETYGNICHNAGANSHLGEGKNK